MMENNPTPFDADFFTRLGIGSASGSSSRSTPDDPGTPVSAQVRCDAFARAYFPAEAVRPAPFQGFCSYTLLVGEHTVVQFRPETQPLDVEIARLASEVYGDLAPRTRALGTVVGPQGGSGRDGDGPLPLRAYAMSLVPGVSLADLHLLRRRGRLAAARWLAVQEVLVRDFARLVAKGWEHVVASGRRSSAPLRGRVGSTLRWRLGALHRDLPLRFRPVVEAVTARLGQIETLLPWVLTHGDVVPGNIMVALPSPTDARGGGGPGLSGLLDWAEAEYLPFGVGLHGLEELLGESSSSAGSGVGLSGGCYPPRGSTFNYYPSAPSLRAAFWAELEAHVPGLRGDAHFRELVEHARLLGVLLWHGIAFDGGRLDRVVVEGVDDEEVQRLDLYLLGDDSANATVNTSNGGGRGGGGGRIASCGDWDEDRDYYHHHITSLPDGTPIDPDDAILDEILDEDDTAQVPPAAPIIAIPSSPSSPPSSSDRPPPAEPQPPMTEPHSDSDSGPARPPSAPSPTPSQESIGEKARKAWNYVRRLRFLGKL